MGRIGDDAFDGCRRGHGRRSKVGFCFRRAEAPQEIPVVRAEHHFPVPHEGHRASFAEGAVRRRHKSACLDEGLDPAALYGFFHDGGGSRRHDEFKVFCYMASLQDLCRFFEVLQPSVRTGTEANLIDLHPFDFRKRTDVVDMGRTGNDGHKVFCLVEEFPFIDGILVCLDP